MILASDADDSSKQRVSIVFPRKIEGDGGWAWDEVAVRESTIAGYGLVPRQTEQLDWRTHKSTVAIPLLGRETEVSSQEDIDILARVLQGNTYASRIR